jgi:hypothetical protein
MIGFKSFLKASTFDDPNKYEGILLNEDPLFLDQQLNQMIISSESPASGLGNTTTASEVPFDLLGISRTSNPDAGAYQSAVFDEE